MNAPDEAIGTESGSTRPVALVVGGGGSIGGAVANRLMGGGYRTVVASRDPPETPHARLIVDITDIASCRRAATRTRRSSAGSIAW